MKNNFTQKLVSVINSLAWYVVVLTGLIITVIPVIWVTVSSFRPNEAIFHNAISPSLETFSPTPFIIQPYIAIFEKGFGIALLNTLIVTTATVVGGILVGSMAGFVFAKMNFPGRKFLFILTIVTFLLPFRAIAIPLFSLITDLGWRNSYQALIVPALFNGVVILLYRQFFMGVPDAFIDSARMDGASWWQIYWRIFLPISGPAAISAGLILFVFQWLAFLWPLIANPSPSYHVVQVAIAKFATEYTIMWNQQFAATVISTLIPLIVIMSLQKYFVGGMSGSEIKG